MSKETVAVVHLNGCDRCTWHTLAIQDWEEYDLISHPLLKKDLEDQSASADILVVTGYATKSDKEQIETLTEKAGKVILYGTCPYSGGIFGLLNQRGGSVIPLDDVIDNSLSIMGCPPSPDVLRGELRSTTEKASALCEICEKKFEHGLFHEIVRTGTTNDAEKCFNNLGLPCSGVVSSDCAQRCVNFETPCRGCVERVTTPSTRMVGFFGSLASQIEVETIGNWWTTDKLGDGEDELTNMLVDVVGTFFRFHLASAYPDGGVVPSTGNDFSDIMIGHAVEEAIQIAGTVYGSKGVSVALNLIDAYEKAAGITPSKEVLELRSELRAAQTEWSEMNGGSSSDSFNAIVAKIRSTAGNEVLSNLFFGGYKKPVENTSHPFESYKMTEFEPMELNGSAKDDISNLSFSTDAKGIIREWSCEL